MRFRSLTSIVVAVVAVLAGCSASSGPREVAATTVAPSTSTTEAAPTTVPEPASVAVFTHDGDEVELAADCYDAGAGAVIVLAERTEPASRLIVNAIVGEAYLEFTDESGEVFEPSLEHLVDFTVEDGSVSSGVVNLVTDLDLETGASTPAGVASFEVDCRSYIHGPPAGY